MDNDKPLIHVVSGLVYEDLGVAFPLQIYVFFIKTEKAVCEAYHAQMHTYDEMCAPSATQAHLAWTLSYAPIRLNCPQRYNSAPFLHNEATNDNTVRPARPHLPNFSADDIIIFGTCIFPYTHWFTPFKPLFILH